eukprot:COSAG02_NODE_4596_length_5179_cov_108.866535_6_plen_33_part_01
MGHRNSQNDGWENDWELSELETEGGWVRMISEL